MLNFEFEGFKRVCKWILHQFIYFHKQKYVFVTALVVYNPHSVKFRMF